MSKYSELVYMVLDEIKGMSDDFSFNEDHVIFLLDKYRGFLLKQRYSDVKKQIPESNYQTLELDLIQVPAISGEPCEGGVYLRSKDKVPFLMQIGTPRVYPTDYYQGEITYVSRDRMRYVGHNKYLQNIIYCSINPDGYLYFKSSNPQFLYLESVRFTGIFQDSKEAAKLGLNRDNTNCNILEAYFPIEDALIPPLIEFVVKELLGASYRPSDDKNDANDNLEGLAVKTK
jgi:hypothetical protein